VNHSTGRPTKYEQERIDAMRRLGCVACAQLGVPNLNELELHHLLDGNVRMGHWFSIFLCAGHHQGRWSETQKEWIPPDLRVSIASGRKAWNRVYPAERILWVKVQQRLRLNDTWPPTKLVPRGGPRHAQSNQTLVEAPKGEAPVAAVLSPAPGVGDRTGAEPGTAAGDRA